MSISIILALIAIGAACFGGYIFLSASSSKPKSAAISTEAQEELALVSKMQEQQLIKDSKKIQDLVKKNQIFKRSYDNVIGKENDFSNPNILEIAPVKELTNQEEVNMEEYSYDFGMGDEFSSQEEFAARSIDNDSDKEVLSQSELLEIEALASSIHNINHVNDINTTVNNKPDEIDYSLQELEDDYSDEQEWLIKHVYNTFISSNISR